MNEKSEPKNSKVAIIDSARVKFEAACISAKSIEIIQNASSAFNAVSVVKSLRDILTDEIMKEVFMPLMNTKIGFLTDRTGRPNSSGQIKPLYDISVVRDAVIDAICFGLLPTGNQMNIIAEKMYPTKEGYTALLSKIGVKYWLTVGIDKSQNQTFAEIPVKIDYEYGGEKKSLLITATVKKDSYSSHDQLRGKAERRAKKQLFEYITGCDLGDGDEDSSKVENATVVDSKMSDGLKNIYTDDKKTENKQEQSQTTLFDKDKKDDQKK